MSDIYLITVTADQLRALKWAAAHSEQVHEMTIPESEKSLAYFTERGNEVGAKTARQNVDNARRHLADIRAASPALYDAKPVSPPAPAPSLAAADEAAATDLPLSGSGMKPPPVCTGGGSLDENTV